MDCKHVSKNLVLDSGAFIKRASLHNVGEKFYTVVDVIQEVRDQGTRDWLQTLPFQLLYREPLPEAVKIVTEFAKKTGDLRVLSTTDIKLIALVYTLEKELVGVDHIRTQPTKKAEWVNPQQCSDKDIIIPGFYIRNQSSSAVTSRKQSECSTSDTVDVLSEKLVDVGIKDGECRTTSEVVISDVITDNDYVNQSTENDVGRSCNDNSCVGKPEGHVGEEQNEDDVSDDSDFEDDDDNDDDDGSWITPSNIEAVKQSMIALNQSAVNDLPVACVTTDYAMQNVLLQMGLRVVSVDGMLIRRTNSKILRCYGCGTETSDCQREFCGKCGNKTLSRVTVSYNIDGTVQYFMSRHKTFSTRGLRYSLPTPKGGKYATNPKLSEDQRQPQQRTSKKSRMKIDVFDANYVALDSPFSFNDVNSRSAMLGYAGRKRGTGQRRRNPNENRKNYGHRK